MNKKTQHIAFAARALGTLAFLAVIGSANADLKMNVTVKGTGAGTLGVPVAGQYVVDFRNGIARIEEPGGMVALFDFNASTVAYLNPTAKTYSIQPIEGMLKPRLGPTLSASITTELSLRGVARRLRWRASAGPRRLRGTASFQLDANAVVRPSSLIPEPGQAQLGFPEQRGSLTEQSSSRM